MVVVSAVSAVVFGKATHAAAAAAHQCSRRTVGRWKRWISELAAVQQLERACTRLQEDGLPGGLAVAGASRGARVARLLKHQLVGFGEVFYLTKSSPALRADLGGIRF